MPALIAACMTPRDLDIAGGTQLAGKKMRRTLGGAPTRSNTRCSSGAGGGCTGVIPCDPHPARRTARAPAADGRVRYAGGTARFEDRPPERNGNLAAVAIAYPHNLPPPQKLRADETVRERQAEQHPRRVENRVAHFDDMFTLLGVRCAGLRVELFDVAGVARERRDFTPRLRDAEQCKHRHQDQCAQQNWKAARQPRPDPQPVVQPDAAVRPGEHDKRELAHARPRVSHPLVVDNSCIQVFGAEDCIGITRADGVIRQQGRYHQA